MFRLLISGFAAVLIHLALIGLPARHQFRPAPVSEPENAISVTISHVRPEPEKKKLTVPVSEPKPKVRQSPKKEPLPEKKAPKPAEPDKPGPVPAPGAEPPLKPEPDPAMEPEPPASEPDPARSEPSAEKPFPTRPADRRHLEPTEDSGSSGNHRSRNPEGLAAVHKEAVPLYRDNPLPRYPRNARLRGHSGTVMLMVLVGETGKPQNIWVFESSGYKSLDDEAVRTVLTWLFEPGTVDGRPRDMWVKIPVTFELKQP